MIEGILIYNKEDYYKNKWFAERIISSGLKYDMDIKLVLSDEIKLIIEDSLLYVEKNNRKLDKPSFVINRSRNCTIGLHFELMGCRVFNNSLITEICNNKIKTHQIINSNGINSVKTIACNKNYFSSSNNIYDYPLILKSVDGHGGNDIYRIANNEELEEKLRNIHGDEFVLQDICSNPGKDIRVFVIGREIVAAVKRFSEDSFKANFSLGGHSEKYVLSKQEYEIVEKIIDIMKFDFVGIDFILDKDNRFLFNEIEDVVGTRTLYKNYDIDIVEKYLEYIDCELKVK